MKPGNACNASTAQHATAQEKTVGAHRPQSLCMGHNPATSPESRMNHILKLQADNVGANHRIIGLIERIHEFRAHIQSSKFGPQSDGTRGDWISTADVNRWLRYIENGTNE
jgi:hypothetical protein